MSKSLLRSTQRALGNNSQPVLRALQQQQIGAFGLYGKSTLAQAVSKNVNLGSIGSNTTSFNFHHYHTSQRVMREREEASSPTVVFTPEVGYELKNSFPEGNPVLETAQNVDKEKLKQLLKSANPKALRNNLKIPEEPDATRTISSKPKLPNLTQPLFDSSNIQYIVPGIHFNAKDLQVTKLENGLTVSTFSKHSNLVCICVAFRAGPRYEKPHEAGISTIINRLTFAHSRKFTEDFVKEYLEDKVLYESTSEYESHSFFITCPKDKVDIAFEFLSDTMLHPKFYQTEIDAAIQLLKFNLETEMSIPSSSTVMTDSILKSCFGATPEGGLGNPSLAIKEDATPEILHAFYDRFHVPSRCTVSAIGIEQDKMLELVNKYMDFSPQALQNNSMQEPYVKPVWKPGELYIEFLERPQSAFLQNIPPSTSFVASFEGVGYKNVDDLFAVNILETILGGGDSFSSGGPGKGIYSVINKHYLPAFQFSNMIAQHYAYSDTGIFSFHASLNHEEMNPGQLPIAILTLLSKMPEYITNEILDQAKQQYKSQVLHSLEDNSALVLNAVNDLMWNNKYFGVDFLVNKIDSVTKQDILDLIDRLFYRGKQPGLVAIGDVSQLMQPPEFRKFYSEICSAKHPSVLSKLFGTRHRK
ncbi:hypothetical protein C9374_001609 [Naegleria lovaniensis]|uniref:Mitochondrial processing peptidase alpha subunit n=1 Tax=Naegleria lovaniensis TaxID=51637 RepID=A0AA88GR05_NAELO|nr:uncharacterized protein C9374_001609 [Naegleria lovaniensis]KAG2387277.1 hypothetical protein C9374_001609 [Naegleria lovaniensis]